MPKVITIQHEERDARKYFKINEELKILEKERQEIRERLIKNTETRIAGDMEIRVASITKQVLDGEAVRAILGEKTPMKPSVQVQLHVRVVA